MNNWIVKKIETAEAINRAIEKGTCTTPAQVEEIAARHHDECFWMGTLNSGGLGMTPPVFLREIGIPASLLGHRYLVEAIALVVENERLVHHITHELYPLVAEKCNTTPSRTERAIRHAIEVAWDRGDIDILQKYFGYTIHYDRGKPSNGEFIATAAEYVAGRAV